MENNEIPHTDTAHGGALVPLQNTNPKPQYPLAPDSEKPERLCSYTAAESQPTVENNNQVDESRSTATKGGPAVAHSDAKGQSGDLPEAGPGLGELQEAGTGSFDKVNGFLTPVPPRWETLGALAQRLCGELSSSFQVVPEAVLVAAATVAGGVAGPAVTLPAASCAPPQGILFLISAPTCSGAEALGDWLTVGIEHNERVNFRNLKKLKSYSEEEKSHFVCTDENDSNPKLPDERIKELSSVRRFSTSLATKHLESALRGSLDQNVFVYAKYQESVTQFLERPSEFEFAAQCFNNSLVELPRKNCSSEPITPYTSAMLISDPETVSGFLSRFSECPTQIQNACLVWDAHTLRPLRARPLSSRLYGEWQDHLFRLYSNQQESSARLSCTSGCQNCLDEFQNDLAGLVETCSPSDQNTLMRLPGLARRLCRGLHLLQSDWREPMSLETAVVAVELAKLFRPRLLVGNVEARCLNGLNLPLARSILAKLTSKGPLTKRALCRTFEKQSWDLFEPTVHRLVSAGVIYRDVAGRYVLKPL